MYPGERGRFPEEACVDEDQPTDDDDGSSDGFAPDDSGSVTAAMSLTEESSMEAHMGGKLGLQYAGSSGSLGPGLDSPAGMDLDMATISSSFVSSIFDTACPS